MPQLFEFELPLQDTLAPSNDTVTTLPKQVPNQGTKQIRVSIGRPEGS